MGFNINFGPVKFDSNDLGKNVGKAVENIVKPVSKAAENITRPAGKAMENVKIGFGMGINPFMGFIGNATETIGDGTATVAEIGGDVIQEGSKAGEGFLDNIINNVGEVAENITNLPNKLIHEGIDLGPIGIKVPDLSNIPQEVATGIGELPSNLAGSIIPGYGIITWFEEMWGKFRIMVGF